MTKTNALSRRKLLGRIGLLAAAGYTVPALTTLSVAQAGSGASNSGPSNSGPSNSGPSNSGASNSGPSGPSNSNSGPSGGFGAGGQVVDPQVAAKEAACGMENLNDPTYLQCLVTNGF